MIMQVLRRDRVADPPPAKSELAAARADLAAAVKAHRERGAELSVVTDRQARAAAAVDAARATRDEAQAAVDAIKRGAVERLVAGNGDAPEPDLKAARATLLEAQDRLEIAEAALAQIAAQTAEAGNLRGAEWRIDSAVSALVNISPDVTRFFEKAREIGQLAANLQHLGSAFPFDPGRQKYVPTMPPNFAEIDRKKAVIEARMAALRTDPNTSLDFDDLLT